MYGLYVVWFEMMYLLELWVNFIWFVHLWRCTGGVFFSFCMFICIGTWGGGGGECFHSARKKGKTSQHFEKTICAGALAVYCIV